MLLCFQALASIISAAKDLDKSPYSHGLRNRLSYLRRQVRLMHHVEEKMTTEITEKNFSEFVEKNDKPVLVDFWASWCGPCRMVSPVVEQLSEAFEGQVDVGKINVDEQPGLAEKFRVMSIPTLYVFKGGEVVNKLVGARPYEELEAALKQVLEA